MCKRWSTCLKVVSKFHEVKSLLKATLAERAAMPPGYRIHTKDNFDFDLEGKATENQGAFTLHMCACM